ncbi:MAG: hypothetical protein KKD11_03885 [Candidatus Omnitrophica bacterium]|nr:hypothetical protein [Candidatus Omnitrophota bacterium]
MRKIRKDYNVKIIGIAVSLCLLYTGLVCADETLRVPFDEKYNRMTMLNDMFLFHHEAVNAVHAAYAKLGDWREFGQDPEITDYVELPEDINEAIKNELNKVVKSEFVEKFTSYMREGKTENLIEVRENFIKDSLKALGEIEKLLDENGLRGKDGDFSEDIKNLHNLILDSISDKLRMTEFDLNKILGKTIGKTMLHLSPYKSESIQLSDREDIEI